MERKGIRLFQKITGRPNTAPLQKAISETRGRSSDLIKRRNKCLMHRFYFYAKKRDLRYEDTITLLGEEFFLAPRTVMAIIIKTSSLPDVSYKEMKSAKELQSMYGFLNWVN